MHFFLECNDFSFSIKKAVYYRAVDNYRVTLSGNLAILDYAHTWKLLKLCMVLNLGIYKLEIPIIYYL